MTMWTETGIIILTVIVIAAIGNLFFQYVEHENGCTAKMVRDAPASMASVAKCPLVRALALPETLLK